MKTYKPKYTISELYKDTYIIADGGLGQGSVYMYLLVGSEKALLIDSGYGLLDLKSVIRTVTDKPVICVCTHGHVDHALGACQFEDAYLHSKDSHVYAKHTNSTFISDMGLKGLMMRPPRFMRNNPSYLALVEQMAEKQYTPLQKLDSIDSFDLGGRIVSWRHVPGHTQGSVAIIDEANKVAFDADACAPGAWLFLEESSPLPDYLKELESYRAFLDEHRIKHRYVGHAKKALSEKYLKQLIKCTQICINKPKKGIKKTTLLGKARIVFAGGSLLFCGVED